MIVDVNDVGSRSRSRVNGTVVGGDNVGSRASDVVDVVGSRAGDVVDVVVVSSTMWIADDDDGDAAAILDVEVACVDVGVRGIADNGDGDVINHMRTTFIRAL